ncbi:hypothetical protein H0A43_07440 [Arcobacter lanthieri]|uniref:hypothetical protein n=1 Tax=Aliarcobacter lanthieri TaxID=1355374 RepID=UPI001923B902|nr:hypothetical protein [Aliarcobacter lanthieri]MBL3520305.1 hypothetical protein [Aliarcobacter lanthieri]
MGKSIILNGDATTMQLKVGSDNLTVDDLVAGDTITITPINAETTRTYGAGNSVNIQRHTAKDVHTVVFRVQKLNNTDKALANYMNAKTLTQVIEGSIKTIYYEDGEQMIENYKISGGSLTTKPTETKNNTDGNASMEYTLEAFVVRLV